MVSHLKEFQNSWSKNNKQQWIMSWKLQLKSFFNPTVWNHSLSMWQGAENHFQEEEMDKMIDGVPLPGPSPDLQCLEPPHCCHPLSSRALSGLRESFSECSYARWIHQLQQLRKCLLKHTTLCWSTWPRCSFTTTKLDLGAVSQWEQAGSEETSIWLHLHVWVSY